MILLEYIARQIVRLGRYYKIACKHQHDNYSELLHVESVSRKCYVIGTTTNGNLGDQAISYSQIRMIEGLKSFDVVEINVDQYWPVRNVLKNIVKTDDVLVIQGGGNVGNEYMAAEICRRDVLRQFKNNRIISFPQTVYFSDDNIGRFELAISKRVYAKHKDFYMFAREEFSYQKMCELFPHVHVYLVPDIVLYYSDYQINKGSRLGALLCLRGDCEGVLTPAEKEEISSTLNEIYGSVQNTDTVIDNKQVQLNNRKVMIEDKLNEFAASEIIITDRLHGMVFAALAGTPCIVLKNYNCKVLGVYQWIKDISKVYFAENVSDLKKIVGMINEENVYYDSFLLRKHYEMLIQVCEGKSR